MSRRELKGAEILEDVFQLEAFLPMKPWVVVPMSLVFASARGGAGRGEPWYRVGAW